MATRSIAVRLRAEVNQFNADMAAAGKAAADAASKTETAWGKSTSRMGGMANKIEQNASALQTVGGAATAAGAAILAVGAAVAKTGISYNTLQQTSRAALATLLGGAQAANAQMDKLDAFASSSPFAKDVFIKAQQQLIGFGMSAEDVVPTLDAIQNAVAAVGGSNEDIAEISNVLAKVTGTGKITAQTFNELGIRGIDAATIIGDQMGKTGNQIRDEVTKGTLDADAALEALTTGMSERFGGAAANVKDTMAGAFDRVKAAWRDLSADLMKPIVNPDGGGFGVDLLNWAADVMRSFQGLPQPIKLTAGAMAGLTGVGLTAGGMFLMLAPRIVETMKAVQQLRVEFPKTSGVITKGAKVAGVAAAAFAALMVAGAVFGRKTAADVGQFEQAMISAGESVDSMAEKLTEAADLTRSGDWLGTDGVDNFGAALDKLSNASWYGNLNKWLGDISGYGSSLGDMAEAVEGVDSAFANFVARGDYEKAAQGFKSVAEQAELQGLSMDEIMDQFPEYIGGLRDIATELDVAVTDQELYNWALGDVPPKVQAAVDAEEGHADALKGMGGAAEDAAESLDEVLDRLNLLSNTYLGSEEAQMAYKQRLDDITQSVKDNGATLDINTEQGRANREQLIGLAEDGLALAEANYRLNGSEEDLQDALRTTYDDLVNSAQQMGRNQEEADELARNYLGIPDEVPTEVWIENYATTVGQAEDLQGALKDIEREIRIKMVLDYYEDKSKLSDLQKENPGARIPSPNYPRYHGGIDVMGMASGSVMTVAQMVKPGDIRFAGDRSDVDEAWIPLDGSPRSHAILMEAIQRMPGFGGGMAAGGVSGDSGTVGDIPVPDTSPVAAAWQSMFDDMLATTNEGWAAQSSVWASSFDAITATTLTAQAGILSATVGHMQGMQATHQQALDGMATLTASQYMVMQQTVNASLAAQRGDTDAAYKAMQSILTTALSAMSQTNSSQWSGMQATQSGHLSTMQRDSDTGFTNIRVTGIDQMAALAAGISTEFGRAPGYVHTELNAVRGVLNDFADAVNDAFGEIGVELPKVPGFWTGGPIPGTAPSDTADNVLIRATPGEYMVRRPSTRKLEQNHPGALEYINRTGELPTFGGAYAGGGMVALDASAKWLQSQGVRITEFGYWGQRVGGHAPGSYHYRPPGQAYDANAGPPGENPTEKAIFDRLVPMLNAMWPSLRTLWRVPHHFNHLHVDTGGSGGAGGGPLGGLLGVLGGNMPADLTEAYKQAAKKKGGQLRDEFAGKLPDGMLGGLGTAAMDMVVKGLVSKAGDFAESFMHPADVDMPGGDAVERWRSTVMQALTMTGLPTTPDYVEAWLRQIRSESGGNPGITQGVRDVNSGGNEAVGLVQVIPGTFAGFRDPRLPNDRRHPLANLVAGMNWAKYKYGHNHLNVIGHGHGYANGTQNAAPGLAWVGENGPELVDFRGGGQAVYSTSASQARAATLARTSQPVASDPSAVNVEVSVPTESVRGALDGMQVTLLVDGEPMRGYINSTVDSGIHDAGRRLSRTSSRR